MAAVETRPEALSRGQTTISVQKTRIPLVTHIITDDDIGLLQGSKMQPVNLGRVIKLLTDPHSAMLYDRHQNSLQRLIRHYQHGFPMKDLVLVYKLLNICADRVEQQPLYEQPLIEVIKICSLPYLKEKTSDEIVYQQIVIESISQLGYLMRVPSNEVRKQICSTLITFHTAEEKVQQVQKFKSTNKDYNRKVIEYSDVSETLVKSLALMENDYEVRLLVLDVLQTFSKGSEKNCNQILLAEGAKRICSRLMDADPTGHLLFQSVEILWNLLENGDVANLSAQLNNVQCISQLRVLE